MTEIEKVKAQIQVLQKKLDFLEELEKTKSPVEECYKDWWGQYPETGTWDGFDEKRWQGFQAGYEFAWAIAHAKKVLEQVQEEQQEDDYPYKKYTPEETEQSLKEAFVKAQQTEKWKEIQKKIDTPEEIWMDEPVEGLVKELEKNPPEGLKFEMGETLEELIERWWCDGFTSKKYYWDMETTIQDLCDRVFLWLPKEQFANSQNLYVELTVEGYNDAIKKIKSKIHNKKV